MSKFIIPEYFNRHCSRWNKKDFLEEYKDKDGLGEKIGIYLRSLEVIADNEEGQRSIRASINNSTISGNVGNVQGIVSKRKSFQQDSLETIERSLRLNSAGLSGDLLTRAFFKLLKECILWDLSTNIDELTEGIFMIDFIAPLFNKTIHYFNYTTTHSWIDVESKASKLRRWYGRCPDYKLNNKDGTITGVFAEVTSPRRKDDEQKIYWDIYRGAIKEIDQDIKQNEICPDEAKRIIISSSDLK
ncbi:hypothetical protein C2G38_2170501 [Gigaspora rosea]|uniref:Uncharacterized protein n=1 Tax=Gigaspora rosea TaxID=44941 RepID=A0A397VUK8_9GLOM|nr:hypothetical protein C2G38_2170501 [Gigaspora rosea]